MHLVTLLVALTASAQAAPGAWPISWRDYGVGSTFEFEVTTELGDNPRALHEHQLWKVTARSAKEVTVEETIDTGDGAPRTYPQHFPLEKVLSAPADGGAIAVPKAGLGEEQVEVAVGTETIQVPAGTFACLKTRAELVMLESSGESVRWRAAGIPLPVKLVATSATGGLKAYVSTTTSVLTRLVKVDPKARPGK